MDHARSLFGEIARCDLPQGCGNRGLTVQGHRGLALDRRDNCVRRRLSRGLKDVPLTPGRAQRCAEETISVGMWAQLKVPAREGSPLVEVHRLTSSLSISEGTKVR